VETSTNGNESGRTASDYRGAWTDVGEKRTHRHHQASPAGDVVSSSRDRPPVPVNSPPGRWSTEPAFPTNRRERERIARDFAKVENQVRPLARAFRASDAYCDGRRERIVAIHGAATTAPRGSNPPAVPFLIGRSKCGLEPKSSLHLNEVVEAASVGKGRYQVGGDPPSALGEALLILDPKPTGGGPHSLDGKRLASGGRCQRVVRRVTLVTRAIRVQHQLI
jgi:hypothetical protein